MKVLPTIQFWLLILIIPFMVTCSPQSDDSQIRIGGIFTLTGPTHESCIPYADGIRNCIASINEAGGINGRKVVLIEADYGYLVPRAREIYTRLVQTDRVHAILGWGTGDTEALRSQVAHDEIPFMSASYSSNLGVIETAPYNFMIGVTYSDQIKIALRYILEQRKDAMGKPRVAFIYNDTPFGRSPVADGKRYANAHGIEIVAEEIVALDAFEARDQLSRIKEKHADYAIIQETAWATSVILKDAKNLKLTTTFIGLNWCADEKVVALAEESAEGFIGILPFMFTDEAIPGIQEINRFNKAKGINIEGYIHRYIQGWTTAKVMAEGIRRAAHQINGPGIKKGLEELRAFSTGGVTAPITFTSENHRGTDKLKIAQVKDGTWQAISGYLSAR